MTAGVRGDDYTSFGNAITWRLTGAWHLDRSGTTLRGSIGTGFMPPSLAARFGSVYQVPNAGIRPERSRGWDVGIEQRGLGGRGTVSATWFHNALRDLIGFEGAPYPALGRNVNVDRARTSGLELGGRLEAGRFDARLAWTLLSARSLSESDPTLVRLIRRPRHAVSGDVLATLSPRGMLGAGFVVVADREDMDFNSFPAARVNPGDYAAARVYGSIDVGAGITLHARVENLSDQRYEAVYGFPALGRSVSASAAVHF
jgi:vitamin B12 transporter